MEGWPEEDPEEGGEGVGTLREESDVCVVDDNDDDVGDEECDDDEEDDDVDDEEDDVDEEGDDVDDVDDEEDDDDGDNGDGVVDRGGGLHLCSWLMVEYGRRQDGHIQAFRFGDGVARWLAIWC